MGDARRWGPVFDDDLIQIDFPDGNWVKVKRYLTAQDQAAAQNAMDMRMKLAGNAKIAGNALQDGTVGGTGSYQLVLLQRMVKAWSFTRNGAALPCDAGHVALLPEHTREYLMERINAVNTEPTEEESENLGSATPTISEVTETAPLS